MSKIINVTRSSIPEYEEYCEEIKSIVDYVSTVNGGHGAVREIIEHFLRDSGDWEGLVEKIYGGV